LKRFFSVLACLVLLLFCAAVGAVFFLPASYLTQPLEQLSQGRVLALNSQGSLWHGRTRLALRSGGQTELARAALLPGELQWQIAVKDWFPLALEVRFSGETLVPQAFALQPGWGGLRLTPGTISLPAEVLEAAGAPFNSLKPGGMLFLSWTEASFQSGQSRAEAFLEWLDARSVLSLVAPLGSYRVQWSVQQSQGQMELSSQSGPLFLSGKGQWNNGRWQMSGVARAEPAQRDALAPLMTWLGQPQTDGSVQWSMGQK